jgi:hypothetical protein
VPSFWIDEWYSTITSYYALYNNLLPYLAADRYARGQYLFTLLQAGSISLWWYTDFFARLPSVIFSLITMIVTALFAYDLLKKHRYRYRGTLFISFLSFFSSWQIIRAREARFYALLSLLTLLSVYLLYRFDTARKPLYFAWFALLTGLGSIFHPFLFWLFVVGGLYIGYMMLEQYINKKTIRSVIARTGRYMLRLGWWLLLYIGVKALFGYIADRELVSIMQAIPSGDSLPAYSSEKYMTYYTQVLIDQLWILYLTFIAGLIYRGYTQKYGLLVAVGWFFMLSMYIIPQWMLVHSRYVYHLMGIITLFGGYIAFLFLSSIVHRGQQTTNNYYRYWLYFLVSFMVYGIIQGYNMSLTPQTRYNIDSTSPKPNFKAAYAYIAQELPWRPIVAGFPHLCIRYTIHDPSTCAYGLRVNLTARKSSEENLRRSAYHNYTATPYINDTEQIDGHLFVLDDLSLRMSIQKDIIDHILATCSKVFEDQRHSARYNYIGVRECRQK